MIMIWTVRLETKEGITKINPNAAIIPHARMTPYLLGNLVTIKSISLNRYVKIYKRQTILLL